MRGAWCSRLPALRAAPGLLLHPLRPPPSSAATSPSGRGKNSDNRLLPPWSEAERGEGTAGPLGPVVRGAWWVRAFHLSGGTGAVAFTPFVRLLRRRPLPPRGGGRTQTTDFSPRGAKRNGGIRVDRSPPDTKNNQGTIDPNRGPSPEAMVRGAAALCGRKAALVLPPPLRGEGTAGPLGPVVRGGYRSTRHTSPAPPSAACFVGGHFPLGEGAARSVRTPPVCGRRFRSWWRRDGRRPPGEG